MKTRGVLLATLGVICGALVASCGPAGRSLPKFGSEGRGFEGGTDAPVITQPTQHFSDWCSDPNASQETRVTVSRLLEEAGTQDCTQAQQILMGYAHLDLSEQGIRDLGPVAALPYLEQVNLRSNPIQDFKPLAKMKRLTQLDLSKTEMTDKAMADIEPALSGLVELDLSGNQVTDVRVLHSARRLQTLDIRGNKVPRIRVLALANALRLREFRHD